MVKKIKTRMMKKYNLYKVGGCIRDNILGIKSKDIDYTFEFKKYFIQQYSYNKADWFYGQMNDILKEDGFEVHCKQHFAYWKWVNERNEERFNMNQKAGQGADLKNMMHLFRLLEMCENISVGKGLKVRSDNVEYLIDIRKGKYDYQNLLEESEKKFEIIKNNFENVDLP